MPTPRNLYLNLPVADLDRSVEFFGALGFTLNPEFSDETAAGMSITEQIFLMLHTHASFARFTPGKRIADATRDAEVLIALDAPDRTGVDETIERAVAAGGSEYGEAMDHGWMYYRAFQDPDGHIWEILHTDMSRMPADAGSDDPGA